MLEVNKMSTEELKVWYKELDERWKRWSSGRMSMTVRPRTWSMCRSVLKSGGFGDPLKFFL